MRTGGYIAAAHVLVAVLAGIAWFAWFKHDGLRRDFGGELPNIESLE